MSHGEQGELGAPRRRRRLLIPEVIQSSATDCGPAALKSLLAGLGVEVRYDALRELCQTGVDGSSIDGLEEILERLGFAAEQAIVPLDHLLLDEARILPAIVVVKSPVGEGHFITAWRRHGPRVQIMDPNSGRAFPAHQRLVRDLYLHEMPVPAGAWQEWAAGEDFSAPLARRLRDLGASRRTRERLLGDAAACPGWIGLGALDAAARATARLLAAGALRRGREAARAVERLVARAREAQDPLRVIPSPLWSVLPAGPDPDGEPQVAMRGAVALRVLGPRGSAGEAGDPGAGAPAAGASPAPDEGGLTAALRQPEVPVLSALARMLREDGLWIPALLAIAAALLAAGMILEVALLRGLLDALARVSLPAQRLGALAAAVAFCAALLLLDAPLLAGALWMGRRLEARFRLACARTIPRLTDRYLQSRLISDLAHRAHVIRDLRQLPDLARQLVQASSGLALTVLALCWLDASLAILAAVGAGMVALSPALLHAAMRERDLRVRTLASNLGRFVLDGLIGLVAIRAHGAEQSLRHEHAALLGEWERASRSLLRAAVTAEGIQAALGHALAALLVLAHLRHGGGQIGGALLVAYLALSIPRLGEDLGHALRLYPHHRSTAVRLLEPLGAPLWLTEDDERAAARAPEGEGRAEGAALSIRGVTVRAGAHARLRDVSLEIAPGSHVAVVGPSGAGKSSLIGLILGWHTPGEGEIRVDGRPLDAAALVRLRAETAWVDPGVHLWNRSLLENLMYGCDPERPPDLGGALAAADLKGVLEALPRGLQTELGEGGGLVSGGEGQRVRVGRALLREGVRLALLDEAFRGVDRAARRRLLSAARARWRGATLLCVTHDVAEALAFDRVIVIEEGRVVEDGAPSALAEAAGSRLLRLLDAEATLGEGWAGVGWRRLALEGGRIAVAAGDEGARPGYRAQPSRAGGGDA